VFARWQRYFRQRFEISGRFYTVSQKRIPAIIDFSVKKDYQVSIIFGKNI